MLLFKYKGSDMNIVHQKREEKLEKNQYVGCDITKIGQPIDIPDDVIIRRIGTEAFEECKWAKIENHSSYVDKIPGMVEKITQKVKESGNDSYKELWNYLVREYLSSNGEFEIMRQYCSLKIIPEKLVMNKETNRNKLLSVLTESDGSATKRKCFEESDEVRGIVLEPISKKPKLYMNEDGKLSKKKGKYGASAVYNKPENDFPVHWRKVSVDKALKILEENEREIPWEQIRYISKVVNS